ncbi:cation:proton antiporter [Cyanobacterium aponinum AL20118]|uniref:Cation:proton antiporter n=1 Tax=Cyanobacterium aponinum AL20115 TaxID=3090662 RepID=A0AAF0ZDI7_9CHRO|nr:cation:proton antiporter [Cyanobacterium aponinum]WPF89685.1 cation:proton antiporter [Cyanobacterium aponinum AL20115]WRL38060.1 cation:proton antiporter [Cyanobacterium aponinum UTEX 3221]
MDTITLIWLALPFLAGFIIYLLPKCSRILSLAVLSISVLYPFWLLTSGQDLTLQLLDNFGVSLFIDKLSGYFILTNSLVTIAVLFYCWYEERKAFFYTQLMILYGSVNACFIGYDFISFYVAIEVISIAAFLLIVYPRTDKSIWIGLRYLFVSNTAMLFYLIGAILIYKANNSFSFNGLSNSPPEAIALILLGLLVKGGVFVSGLWLPLTHASAETPVSALLSGVVVKAGVYPLIRLALIVDEMDHIVRIVAIATALLGVIYAIFESDVKRMLAFHTVSQLGFVLASPPVAGIYALFHGLVKSSLFLMAGSLPTRNIKELKHTNINTYLWIALVIASLSISGVPLLAGYCAKVLTVKNLYPWQVMLMNIAAVGTAISFAKFIFLPHDTSSKILKQNWGFWFGVIFLLAGLIFANGFYLSTYTLSNIIKALITVFIGWLVYFVLIKKAVIKLPRILEDFDHLIGIMSLTLVGLFWMVLP